MQTSDIALPPPRPKPGPVILTLHGTNDADASDDGQRWWQRGSPFARKLLDELTARGVTGASIVPIRWSGANSDFDRNVGATKLAEALKKLDRAGRRHAILAHSHGGNVAMEGMAKAPASPMLSGVVTFGTPFFKRQLKTAPWLIAAFQIALGAIIAPTMLWLLAVTLPTDTNKKLEAIVVFGGLLALALWALAAGWRSLRAGAMARTRLAKSLKPERWLVVHSPRDEAMRLLEAAGAVSPRYVTVASAERSLMRFASIAGVIASIGAFAFSWRYFLDPILEKASRGEYGLATLVDFTFLLLIPVVYAVVYFVVFAFAKLGGAWAYAKVLSHAIHGGVIGAAYGGDGRYKLVGVTRMPTYLNGATERRLDALSIGGVDEKAVFLSAQKVYDSVVADAGPDGGIADPDLLWKRLSDALYHNAYMRDDGVISEVAAHLASGWTEEPAKKSPEDVVKALRAEQDV